MKKIMVVGVIVLALTSGCTNMSRTQQSMLSGAALGTVSGLGIAAVSGGSVGLGAALAGAGIGVLAGAVVGSERNW